MIPIKDELAIVNTVYGWNFSMSKKTFSIT